MVASNFPNRPFGLREGVWLRYQDVNGNTSHVSGELWIDQYNGNYNTYSLGNYSSFTFHLNGSQVAGWSFGYDFRAYDNLRLCYVEAGIGHNADGTKYFSIDGYANVDIMGYTEVHSGITLPTIPRASTVQFTTPDMHSLVPGEISNVNTNRASSAFTHDLDYFFGTNPQTRAMTGIGQTGSWTPPLSLINQMPNTTTDVGRMRTHTYSGGSMIGYTETPFRLTVPASVIPTWTSATIADSTPGVQTAIGAGRYLQNVSKLTGTIAGAAGVYGSTISSYRQVVGSEVINNATAEFTKVLSVAGTAVPVTQEVTDSRGRKQTLTTNINVMPYSLPVVSSWSVQRADAAGTPAAEGTNLRVNIVAAVQSIINSTERNRMTIQVYTKLRTDSTWTLQATPVNDSVTLGYSSYVLLAGPFGVNNAYDIQVKVVDKFSTTTVTNSAGVGRVYMHWGDPGFGMGKYYERGMLDVQGDLWTRGSMWADSGGGFLETGRLSQNVNTFSWQGRFRVVPNGYQSQAAPVGLPAIPNADTFHWNGEQYISATGGGWRRLQRIWPMSDENMERGSHAFRFVRHMPSSGTWSAWRRDDPSYVMAKSVANAGWDWLNGRHPLTADSKVWIFDNVFTADFIKYEVSYYWYHGGGVGNGAWFRLRSGGADISTGYNYQLMYISGTGTPAGSQATNQSQVGFPANSGNGQHGSFEIFNPMYQPATTIQKGYSGQNIGGSNGGITNWGGWLGGVDAVACDGFKISLSNTGLAGVVGESWVAIRGIA